VLADYPRLHKLRRYKRNVPTRARCGLPINLVSN